MPSCAHSQQHLHRELYFGLTAATGIAPAIPGLEPVQPIFFAPLNHFWKRLYCVHLANK